MALRRVLLEENYENVQKSLSSLGHTKENYDILSEFYTECEVKGIVLDQKVVQLIIKFVVEYRLKYSNENGIPEKCEDDLNETVKVLEEIVGDYLDSKFENPIEEFVILKCVARLLKPIKNHPLKVPWQEVQFIICIFLAGKSDRKRDQFKFIDDYFQLMVHEDLIRDVLQLTLNCIRDNSFDDAKWNKFNKTYSILHMYYLLLKSAHYYNVIDKNADSDTSDKASIRGLQVIGECCHQMSKLQYEGFDAESYPLCDTRLFSRILKQMTRKRLSAKEQEIPKESNIELFHLKKLGIFILDMIQMFRNEIERLVVEEYKNMLEKGDVLKLFNRVRSMNFQKNIIQMKGLLNPSQYMDKEIEILSKFGSVDNFLIILLSEINEHVKKSFQTDLGDTNSNVFGFITWFKNNHQKPIDCIKTKIKAISLKPFIDISTLLAFFVKFLPESAKARNMTWVKHFIQIQECIITNPDYTFSSEDFIIEQFLKKIHSFISNQAQKEEFSEIEYNLMTKRSLLLELKVFNDVESIKRYWPNDSRDQKVTEEQINSYEDPLKIFVDSHISDHKKIDNFFGKIGWENGKAIVDRVRKDTFKELTDSFDEIDHNFGKNDVVDEIYFLDCFEILKKMEIDLSQDYNYLDFDCSIPVALNLKNYLSQGDIYVEIFCPNLREIVQSHLKIISKSYKDIKRFDFWRRDSFETVRKDLNKHRKWAREVWETLNFNNDFQILEKIETFKVRDYNNLSLVHYNLRNVSKENVFLMYLIEKVTQQPSFKSNILFEKMLEESTNKDYLNYNTPTVDLFVDKFMMESEPKEKNLILCIILCQHCKNLDFFREVYLIQSKLTHFLNFTMAHNLLEITNTLLNDIDENANIELILKQAIQSGNEQWVTKLIEKNSTNPTKPNTNWSSLETLALEVGNIEILDLVSNTKSLSLKNRNLLIKTVIKCNLNARICKNVVEKYLSPISKDESELLLQCCCFTERLEVLRYLLNEFIPRNHWNEIKKSILISCFNINSLEILNCLISKGAYLNDELLNNSLPFFNSEKIVEALCDRFGTSALHRSSKKLTFVRKKTVAEVLLNQGYALDWFELNSLPLGFILQKKPEPTISFEKLRFLLRRSSPETSALMFKYLKDHKIKFPFFELPDFVSETRFETENWASQLHWEEPDQRDFNSVIEKECLTYVGMVLRRGRDIDFKDGFTSIAFLAGPEKLFQVLKLFKEHEVDLSTRYEGNTLLEIAIYKGEGNITDSMRFLSKFGVKSKYNMDFNNLSLQDKLLFGVLNMNMELIQEALTSGANINFRYEKFRYGTILHIASYVSSVRRREILTLGLKSRIDSSIGDIDNYAAPEVESFYSPTMKILKDLNTISSFNLFWAGVLRNDIDLIRKALDKGADVNCVFPGLEEFTALHLLSNAGEMKAVKFLLSKGADPLKANYAHRLPIDNTIPLDKINDFKVLFKPEMDLNKYFKLAVEENSVKIVKFLLEKGANVDTIIHLDYSALKVACTKPNDEGLELAKVLIEHKINLSKSDVSLAWDNKNYEIAKLFYYKVYNYPKTVQEFEIAIDKGLNINLAPEPDLRTYLHLACYFQEKEIVKFLLDNGANFLQNDLSGKSPLSIVSVTNSPHLKLFFKPLLIKFYSMWSKYPSDEYIDFYNKNQGMDFELIIVVWFDAILRVSGLFNTDDKNLSPFELFASGLWLNNMRLINNAIYDGLEINYLLKELVFVSFVLYHDYDQLDEILEFVKDLGGDVLSAAANAKKLALMLLDMAVPLLNKFPMHPHFREPVELYKLEGQL